MRLLLVTLITVGIFTGCTTTNPATTAPPSPTATVTPSLTLDIEATIEARLTATIEARPTPTTPPTAVSSLVPTLAPDLTETPSPTPTAILPSTTTPDPTPVPTVSPTPTPTATPTPIPTASPTPPPTPALRDLHDTQNNRWLKRAYRDLYRQIQRFPWVQDGLSQLETNTIDELVYMGADEIDSLRTVLGLPWLQDNILETEYEAIDRLGVLGYHDTANLTSVLSLPWVQDAISETEYDIIYWLASLGYDDEKAVAAVIAMPFLKSPDTSDVRAIRGMHRLAYKSVLSALTSHPAFQADITDAQTTLVAATGAIRDTEEIGRLLDPGYATLETVSSGTKLTPDLKISIVRTGSQSRPGTVEAVKDAVEFVERVMGLPLLVDHVLLVLNDQAVTTDYAGTNYGFAIGYLPEYEQRQDTYEWRSLQAGLVHEVAHYFWRGNADWVDEGVADTVEYMYGLENGLSRGQLQPHRKDCEAHDLAMLSEWDPDTSSSRYLCNYYLGQGLFRELLESLGAKMFGEKLQGLYRRTRTEQEAGQTPGITEVQQIFTGQATLVDKHWAGALNAPENRPFDEGIYRENHHLIQWNQHPTYDGRSVSFEGILVGDAVLVNDDPRSGGYSNLTLSLADEYEHLGSILPNLSNATWTLGDPGDTVASKYFFYPATRKFAVTFPFPRALDSPQDYIVVVWGFQDASRTLSIGDYDEGGEILAYARIRVP